MRDLIQVLCNLIYWCHCEACLLGRSNLSRVRLLRPVGLAMTHRFIRNFCHHGLVLLLIVLSPGCATTSARQKGVVAPSETTGDVQSAVVAVTDAIRNRNVDAKYCPLCGKHYSGHLEVCPLDQTPLKDIEE